MADMMDKTINSIITAFIAVVLIASAFIPTVLPMINGLTDEQTGVEGAEPFTALLTVVVTITIIGIIIGVIKMYTKNDDGDDYED